MSIEAVFAHFPVLTTERLILRQMQVSDADALFTIKSNFEVTKHYGQEPHHSPDDSLAWIEKLWVSYTQREDLAWGVTLKDDETLIGVTTLWNLDPGYQHGEIGYELHPAYEKRGIMTEALKAVLAFAFTELGLHRLEATPFAENAASRGLLQRLGFTLEGTLRERYFFRERYKDQLYYGLLKAEWEQSAK